MTLSAAEYDFLAQPLRPHELGRLGPYPILKILGHGGMGIVFLAEDLQLGCQVAIKTLRRSVLENSGSALDDFLREARAMAALREHYHIATIYTVDQHSASPLLSVPYLVMELLQGESLATRLARAGKLSANQALRIVHEIAEGLAAAHEQGLIHGDLKSGNVWLVKGRDRVKLLDFGIAQKVTELHLVRKGLIAGTAEYMSPEQARGEPLDGRSDLFSLGVICYRVLTGVLPFQSSEPDKKKRRLEILEAVQYQMPPPPCRLAPEVPRGLSDLTMELLAKHPERRYPSADAVVAALDGIAAFPQGRSAGTPLPGAVLAPLADLLLQRGAGDQVLNLSVLVEEGNLLEVRDTLEKLSKHIRTFQVRSLGNIPKGP
jgi:serine/threonine protein kinase